MTPALRTPRPRARTLQVWRRFSGLLRPHAPGLAGAVALGLVVVVAEVLRPWPLQVVFDHVLAPRGAAASRWPLAPVALSPGAIVAWAAAAVLLVSAIGGLATYAQTLVLSRIGQRLTARVRRDLFRHLVRLPLSFHGSRRHGDLMLRLTGDIVLLRELLVGALSDGLAAGLVLVATLGVMLWLDAGLTLISLLVTPLIALASAAFAGRLRRTVRRAREKEGGLAAEAGEVLGAIAMVQAYGVAERFGERIERANRSSLRSGLKAARLEALLGRTLDLLTAVGVAVTLALGARRVMSGALTPGELLVFLAYQRTLYRPVRQIARLVTRAAKSAACGERVLEVLDTESEIADQPDAVPCPPLAGEIRFEDVHVTYPRGDAALRGVDLRIPAGATVRLRGPSGAGKSTLISLLPRLLDPTRGCVRLDGRDVRGFTLASLREQVTVVFQESVLFGLSVRENLLLGRPDASEADIAGAIEQAGLDAVVRELPNGLDAVVGERGGLLSGGQRQRVALARAALRRAPILVLDEPLAHLDGAMRRHVADTIGRIARGRTVIVVTHDDVPGLALDLDVTLREGRIVEVTGPEAAALRSAGA